MEEYTTVHQIAEELRKKGQSYSEINKTLGVAKSTLSVWFSEKQWSKSVRARLNSKYLPISTARIALMNRSRKLEKIKRYKRYLKEAEIMYERLKNNPLFVSGVSIYWGEGEKVDTGRVSVINTDVGMLQVMINFYRKILQIPEHKIRAGLFIYRDLDPTSLLKYWSRKIKLSKNQFIKSQILPGKIKSRRKRSPCGMCNIYVSSTELKVKMMHWIKLLASEHAVSI
ncbi:hypothetical protein A2630_02060 [Candidatus Woesebacteria bacterium RIFCSPHIGHO2_01_FULL_44_10]|uniref:Uncharacterized protein n=1 Tax=Candidatus Woesebacteria bacterium RIFCSPLOWO2_01_FULL_44_14 TaxID=1802525 RepID=A0A1F8BY36_9BACT|nr:MAG: hypothetical protein A2630_02060 [Candidatus Woesebacteria bacterium RIFCSPHIGHO2_01_FULL_44_10]OGM55781.1 MAG: hypothetical protein A3F62_04105 [Candidatus Woesebacteria bacterium RIFCSPHIGHO2_12_FULL_44_11]OGM68976.1 MAG: hypothetical protein A2975_02225 [Candidatus Woesebacteria bacterium RIFCSPLOWO2_01_FULL_44_14]